MKAAIFILVVQPDFVEGDQATSAVDDELKMSVVIMVISKD